MNTLNSTEWLNNKLAETGIGTLTNLAALTGINKGTLSKYFNGKRRPSIDAVAPLCEVLQVAPEALLKALNAY
jgi:transcriptional regulator with XRE-family HTH domain